MSEETPREPDGPRKEFHRSRARSRGDAVLTVLIRVGLVPNTFLLTTTGRRSGNPRTNPVTIVEIEGRRWLVAPYGPRTAWVHNARANPSVVVHRLAQREFTVQEVLSAQDAGPVLKRYVEIAAATRPYFTAKKGSPVEAFIAEADDHPVFELTPRV